VPAIHTSLYSDGRRRSLSFDADDIEQKGQDMYRFTFFIAMAMILGATAATDAAARKKSGATADRSSVTASKPKPQRVAKPTAPSRQGWPTSWSDGSFRYGD
jgi:hypothetical protein